MAPPSYPSKNIMNLPGTRADARGRMRERKPYGIPRPDVTGDQRIEGTSQPRVAKSGRDVRMGRALMYIQGRPPRRPLFGTVVQPSSSTVGVDGL